MKNESGKHYFSLDTSQYTLYPDEQEILLQAGLSTKMIRFEEHNDITIFELATSESLIRWGHLLDKCSVIFPLLSFFINSTIPMITNFNDPENYFKRIDYREPWYVWSIILDIVMILPMLILVYKNIISGLLPAIIAIVILHLVRIAAVVFDLIGNRSLLIIATALSIFFYIIFLRMCIVNRFFFMSLLYFYLFVMVFVQIFQKSESKQEDE